MTQTYPRWFSRALFLIMLGAVLIRLFYWHYTDRTWEDALITVLHSENAARGLGLTHLQPPGEPPLHGFTSPISVLIPLVGDLVHVGWGLPLLKLVSAFFGAIAAWLGARIARVIGLPPALALTAAAYLAFEHHQILWGMAGMETQVVTVAYLWSIYALQRGTQWQKGLSLGFVMLARPDAAIWVGIALAVECWRARKQSSWRSLVPVVGGLVLVYGPWLLFAFLYYGSVIPNTIYAKELGYPGVLFQFHSIVHGKKLQWLLVRVYDVLGGLGLSYGGNGTGYFPLWHGKLLAALMMLFCAAGAVLAIRRRSLDAVILFAFGITYSAYLYLCAPTVFGWYTVPVDAAVLICSLYGLWGTAERYVPVSIRGRVVAAAGALYILAIVSILPLTFRSDKYVQMYIESGVRKQVGLYLGRVSLPGDTIGSESLGYVGYYSHRVVYDYPGLCSRRVIQYLRDHPHGRDMIDMMDTLRPTYLVLRPREFLNSDGNIRYPWLQQNYELVRMFQAPQIAHEKILWSNTNIDFAFAVFRLKSAPYSHNQ